MKVTPSHSLRRRLLWFVLVAILLAAVLQAVTAYRGALRQADAMFDDHLQQMARSLRGGIPLALPQAQDDDGTRFDLYVQIWGQDGTQIFRSTRSALPPRAVLGFSDVEANGNQYRVYTLQTPLQTVQIAQDLSARTARARALALQAVLPFAWLTPLLMLAVWWIIKRPTKCGRWSMNSTCCLAGCAALSMRKRISSPTPRMNCARPSPR